MSSVSSTAAAPASAASAMPPSTWSATNGSTTPSIRSSTTTGEPDCAAAPGPERRARGREEGEHRCASKGHHVTGCIIAPARSDGAYPARRESRRRAGVCLGDRVVGRRRRPRARAASRSPARCRRIDRDTRRLMVGSSWHAGCPTPLRDLRLVRVTYRGFDDRPRHGRLAVHRRWADEILVVFRRLYRRGSRSVACGSWIASMPTTASRCVTTTRPHSTAGTWPGPRPGPSTPSGGPSTSTPSRTRTSTARTSPRGEVAGTSTGRTFGRGWSSRGQVVRAGLQADRLGLGRDLVIRDGLPALLGERPLTRASGRPSLRAKRAGACWASNVCRMA